MRTLLQTSIGPVEFYANDAANVYIGCPSGERVVVRGIKYYASVHLELKDGEWSILRGDYRNLHASRDEWRKEPSASARTAILKAFTEAWVAYLKDHPNTLADAGLAAINRQIESLGEEIAGIENDLKEKQAAIESKRGELKNLLASLTS